MALDSTYTRRALLVGGALSGGAVGTAYFIGAGRDAGEVEDGYGTEGFGDGGYGGL